MQRQFSEYIKVKSTCFNWNVLIIIIIIIIYLTQQTENQLQLVLDSWTREEGSTTRHFKEDTSDSPIQLRNQILDVEFPASVQQHTLVAKVSITTAYTINKFLFGEEWGCDGTVG